MDDVGPFWVLYHPEAEDELVSVKAAQATEHAAILNVADKLRQLGPRLPAPHQSALKGKDGRGLRELRPRSGRSRWRPIYKQVTADHFVILAIAPEAQVDARRFGQAVRRAVKRLATIEVE